MKQTISTVKVLALAIVAAGVLAGCRSREVNDSPSASNKQAEKSQQPSRWQRKLAEGTGFVLSLDPSEFTISDQRNEGGFGSRTTYYTVTTNKGERYSCYMVGDFMGGIVGVGEPVCRDAPGSSNKKKGKKSRTVSRTCNELLRAAGKCE
jgi:hypothetical protein